MNGSLVCATEELVLDHNRLGSKSPGPASLRRALRTFGELLLTAGLILLVFVG